MNFYPKPSHGQPDLLCWVLPPNHTHTHTHTHTQGWAGFGLHTRARAHQNMQPMRHEWSMTRMTRVRPNIRRGNKTLVFGALCAWERLLCLSVGAGSRFHWYAKRHPKMRPGG